MTNYKLLTTSLIILALLIGSQSVLSDPIPGQAVLKMTAGGKPDDLLRGSGAQVNDSIPGRQTYLIGMDSPDDLAALVEELETDSQVIYIEPNYSLKLPESFQMSISFPDDFAPPFLFGVEPNSFYNQPVLYSIGIEQAQEVATGNGITIAVIDNGVDFSHPLLSTRLSDSGYDFIALDNDPSYEAGEVAGHGTFVSGLIALTAPDCQILSLRAFDANGNGNSFAIAEAISYAVDQGADLINMSFGSYENSRVIAHACNSAITAGLPMVAASGNNATIVPTYPAAYPGIIAVSGINSAGGLAEFSNYGDYIDVCAPAVDLYSSLAGDDLWGTWSGTSFSAPLVSATCAMVLQIRPDYSTFLMEEYLRQTASLEFTWGFLTPPDPAFGFGRLDVANSVLQAATTEVVEYGDLNGNGTVNIGDIVFLLRQFQGNGQTAVAPGNPDVNCDGIIDTVDIEYFIKRVFHNGPRSGGCQ